MGGLFSYFYSDPTDNIVNLKTGFSNKEKKQMKYSWDQFIRPNLVKVGTDAMLKLFAEHPEIKSVFPDFYDVPEIELENNVKFHVHCQMIMGTLNHALDAFLSDDVEMFSAILTVSGERHGKRKIKPLQFEYVKKSILESLQSHMNLQSTDELTVLWSRALEAMIDGIITGINDYNKQLERKVKVKGSTDRNSAKLEQSLDNLDPTRCIKLLKMIHSKLDGKNCQTELQKLDRKTKDVHQIIPKILLRSRQSVSTRYIKRKKRFTDFLRNFIGIKDIPVKGKLMPLIFATRRFNSSPEIKNVEMIKIETRNLVTPVIFRSYTTVLHEAVTTMQSKVHSDLIKGTDDKITQLMSERGEDLANDGAYSVGEMSSICWIAFIIFLLLIILTMFIITMITIYKNREKDGCDRKRFGKNEYDDDDCPLMNYSSMSPGIERGWTTSSTGLTPTKPQANSFIISSLLSNISQKHEDKLELKNPNKSAIIMKDKQEQTYKVVKKAKPKVKKAKVKNIKSKKRKKYEIKEHRLLNENCMKKRIINSLRRNKQECKCCDCDAGENDDFGANEDRNEEHEKFNIPEFYPTLQDATTETDDTLRKLEYLKQLNIEKPNSVKKIAIIGSRSPRLSFPMACTNKDCSARQLSIDYYADSQRSNFE